MMPNPDFFIIDEALSAAEASLCEHHPRVNRLIRLIPQEKTKTATPNARYLKADALGSTTLLQRIARLTTSSQRPQWFIRIATMAQQPTPY